MDDRSDGKDGAAPLRHGSVVEPHALATQDLMGHEPTHAGVVPRVDALEFGIGMPTEGRRGSRRSADRRLLEVREIGLRIE